jgi:hypothetical protein
MGKGWLKSVVAGVALTLLAGPAFADTINVSGNVKMTHLGN